jgi:hypothetical protein
VRKATTGRIRDFHPWETCAAKHTIEKAAPGKIPETAYMFIYVPARICAGFMYLHPPLSDQAIGLDAIL